MINLHDNGYSYFIGDRSWAAYWQQKIKPTKYGYEISGPLKNIASGEVPDDLPRKEAIATCKKQALEAIHAHYIVRRMS
jgi:hypothetical protein